MELRWAAAVQEIKLREKEEQRQIKEQIREEDLAQREFQRAIRDAGREEEGLRKAMEKVRGLVEKASVDQREKYEAQLEEMAARLRQAGERNQRALSMAQQTKIGHVYVISNVGSLGEDVYKIGLTRRLDPIDRVYELSNASVPFSFDVHAMIFSENAPELETTLHRHFLTSQVNKVNPRKEFFRVSIATIREELEKLNIKTQWSMTAAAKQYRETLALERTLQVDPEKGYGLLQQQMTELPFPTINFKEEEEEAGTLV
jgi:T5orf172 domain